MGWSAASSSATQSAFPCLITGNADWRNTGVTGRCESECTGPLLTHSCYLGLSATAKSMDCSGYGVTGTIPAREASLARLTWESG